MLDTLRQLGEQRGDSGQPVVVPEGFDMAKFNRGKKFFQDNIFSCTLAMLSSLVCGFSVNNLLQALVFTHESDEPRKSLLRYVKTFHHLATWHFGNIWHPGTKAYKSITTVRQMHNSVRKDLMKAREMKGTMMISQYDMSLVQCGFIGALVLYPSYFGIHCSEKELDDYIYFWYGVGYALGITDENNICKGGYNQAKKICKEIEEDILIPAMDNPPRQFWPIAQAFVDGMNLGVCFRLFSLEAFLAFSRDIMLSPRLSLSFGDYLRNLFLQLLVLSVKYVPGCRNIFNWFICKVFKTKEMI